MTELESIAALIDHETARYKRLPHFPAVVVKQNGDLTVDVQPDSPYLPGLSALPLRTFIPGATVKVQAGTRVHVVFENGDTKLPVAVPIFDQSAGALLQLAIACSDIRLGSASAGHAAVLGDTWKGQEDAFDGSMEDAWAALASSLASLLPPTHTAAIADGQAVAIALTTLAGSIATALTNRSGSRSSALSNVVKISS